MRLTVSVGGDFVTGGGGGFGWTRRGIGGSFGTRSGGGARRGGFSRIFVVREAEEHFRLRFGGGGSGIRVVVLVIFLVVAGAAAEVPGSVAAAHGDCVGTWKQKEGISWLCSESEYQKARGGHTVLHFLNYLIHQLRMEKVA